LETGNSKLFELHVSDILSSFIFLFPDGLSNRKCKPECKVYVPFSLYLCEKLIFTSISSRFLRSAVPSKPEVDVHLAENATIELSWKLKCKNGVFKEFHVTYFRVDDTFSKKLRHGAQTENNIFPLNLE